MTNRQDVVNVALSFNGVEDGSGYDAANPFSTDLGRPAEAWCGDFVTDVFRRSGLLLPVIQPGCRTGFAYVPDAVVWAQKSGAWKTSWQAQPADLVTFDWNGDGVADHVELVEEWAGGALHTVGGNSGPSNVDGHRGVGGVHRHVWSAPQGHGNNLVLGIVDTSKMVSFGAGGAPAPRPVPAPTKPAPGVRLLMLKSPYLRGGDVSAVQMALNSHGQTPPIAHDGVFGPATRGAVMAFQRRANLGIDGVVGPQTRQALGLS